MCNCVPVSVSVSAGAATSVGGGAGGAECDMQQQQEQTRSSDEEGFEDNSAAIAASTTTTIGGSHIGINGKHSNENMNGNDVRVRIGSFSHESSTASSKSSDILKINRKCSDGSNNVQRDNSSRRFALLVSGCV